MPRDGDYEPNQLIPGTVYQVIRLLGAGGMGSVYEVEDTTVGKRYVLKTLHADLRDRKELAVRISKEARTLAKLSHANIVEVVTAGATADEYRLPYFVMQKLNGHTLRSILSAKRQLPLETAYGIAIDLLDALEHAHAYGVIHRDVKPENIFIHRNVNGTYVTKLLDFGVMRLLSAETGLTGHRFVGTLRYAPPEQLMGGEVTPRTDLYSAGLVLYEMIAGRGPFDDEANDRDVASAHIQREAPPLSTYAPVPLALEDLVTSALSKDPAGRPKDAFTFAAALRELTRDLSEMRRVEPHAPRVETMGAVIGHVTSPASMTNLDEVTRAELTATPPPPPAPRVVPKEQAEIAGAPPSSRAAVTLEEAEGSGKPPQATLRMNPVPVDAVDRNAPTRIGAPPLASAASAKVGTGTVAYLPLPPAAAPNGLAHAHALPVNAGAANAKAADAPEAPAARGTKRPLRAVGLALGALTLGLAAIAIGRGVAARRAVPPGTNGAGTPHAIGAPADLTNGTSAEPASPTSASASAASIASTANAATSASPASASASAASIAAPAPSANSASSAIPPRAAPHASAAPRSTPRAKPRAPAAPTAPPARKLPGPGF